MTKWDGRGRKLLERPRSAGGRNPSRAGKGRLRNDFLLLALGAVKKGKRGTSQLF